MLWRDCPSHSTPLWRPWTHVSTPFRFEDPLPAGREDGPGVKVPSFRSSQTARRCQPVCPSLHLPGFLTIREHPEGSPLSSKLAPRGHCPRHSAGDTAYVNRAHEQSCRLSGLNTGTPPVLGAQVGETGKNQPWAVPSPKPSHQGHQGLRSRVSLPKAVCIDSRCRADWPARRGFLGEQKPEGRPEQASGWAGMPGKKGGGCLCGNEPAV